MRYFLARMVVAVAFTAYALKFRSLSFLLWSLAASVVLYVMMRAHELRVEKMAEEAKRKAVVTGPAHRSAPAAATDVDRLRDQSRAIL